MNEQMDEQGDLMACFEPIQIHQAGPHLQNLEKLQILEGRKGEMGKQRLGEVRLDSRESRVPMQMEPMFF